MESFFYFLCLVGLNEPTWHRVLSTKHLEISPSPRALRAVLAPQAHQVDPQRENPQHSVEKWFVVRTSTKVTFTNTHTHRQASLSHLSRRSHGALDILPVTKSSNELPHADRYQRAHNITGGLVLTGQPESRSWYMFDDCREEKLHLLTLKECWI